LPHGIETAACLIQLTGQCSQACQDQHQECIPTGAVAADTSQRIAAAFPVHRGSPSTERPASPFLRCALNPRSTCQLHAGPTRKKLLQPCMPAAPLTLPALCLKPRSTCQLCSLVPPSVISPARTSAPSCALMVVHWPLQNQSPSGSCRRARQQQQQQAEIRRK
jgi:hypothetical protein